MQFHTTCLISICFPGNELSGNGVGVRVSADQYASDTIALQNLVQEVYSNQQPKPLTIAPGGFFDVKWFKEFMAKSSKSVDVVTHHIYNLGPGASILQSEFELF